MTDITQKGSGILVPIRWLINLEVLHAENCLVSMYLTLKHFYFYFAVAEKPQFFPDPALSDHGQAHPEDADLYSTRG